MKNSDAVERIKTNHKWGAEAERIVKDYFTSDGFTIRETNWHYGSTVEIDLILERQGMVVFVEVKARKGDRQDAADAVDTRKRSKIIKGADAYLRGLPFLYSFRFDIVTITGSPGNFRLEHIPDAYMPPVNGKY